jgi:hypothetical protein
LDWGGYENGNATVSGNQLAIACGWRWFGILVKFRFSSHRSFDFRAFNFFIMKTSFALTSICFIGVSLIAQTSRQQLPPQQSADQPYVVVSRDANSRVWERTTYEQSPTGEMLPHKHSYTELATGLHYQKDGEWVESQEKIEIQPQGGAAAIQGHHQV